MLKIAICDDERIFLDSFNKKLTAEFEKYDAVAEIYAFENGNELVERISEFDVLFLDIEMPEIKGNKIADIANKIVSQPVIVFVTGHTEFVLDAFEYKIFRFLRKSDLNHWRFESVVKAVIEEFKLRNERMTFNLNTGTADLELQKIIYFQIYGHDIHIKTASNVFCCIGSLKEFERSLKEKFFIRVDRNHLVNSRFISKILDNKVVLLNNEKFKITSKKIKVIKSAYHKFLIKR